MVRHSKEDYLEDQEVQQLFDATKNDVERFVVVMLTGTGMRAEEFSMMRKQWIRWQDGVIQIPSHDEVTAWEPKSKAGARKIPIVDDRVERILKAWFLLNENVHLHRSSIWRLVKEVARRTGIEKKVYPHCLRATFACKLSALGYSPASIKYIMGWAQLRTAEAYVEGSGVRAIQEARAKWRPY